MPKVSRKITIHLRRPEHIVLALVPSSERGKPPYKISLDRQNLIFCNCKSWRYSGHTCKHLTAFRQSIASTAEHVA